MLIAITDEPNQCTSCTVNTATAAGTPCASDRGRGVAAMASAGGADAQTAAALAGRNCRKEFNLTRGWYDVCN